MTLEVVAAKGLPHNPLNAVTQSIDVVTLVDGSRRVRKRIGNQKTGAPERWRASHEPGHWNWWEREAHVYRSDSLRASLIGSGLAIAAAEVAADDAGFTLMIEWVEGTAGPDFDLMDQAALARGLGRWQARAPLDEPWCSRGFLRQYSGSKPVPSIEAQAWEAPLVRDLWPPGLEAGWARLAGARERLLGIAERVPRVTSHLDVWPVNALRRPSGEVVMVDWAFCGDGAVGEDVGNLIPDSVFDLFWPAERLDELAETCITEYVAGLREAGWAGDEQLVRLGVMATAVKYTWLLPATVAQARDATHSAYFRHVDARALYTARGAAFALLVDWADEALRIADRLGW